jgi:hypothetical protein
MWYKSNTHHLNSLSDIFYMSLHDTSELHVIWCYLFLLKCIFSFMAIFIRSILYSIASVSSVYCTRLNRNQLENIQAYIQPSQNLHFFVELSVYFESKHQFYLFIYLFTYLFLNLKYYTVSNTIYLVHPSLRWIFAVLAEFLFTSVEYMRTVTTWNCWMPSNRNNSLNLVKSM